MSGFDPSLNIEHVTIQATSVAHLRPHVEEIKTAQLVTNEYLAHLEKKNTDLYKIVEELSAQVASLKKILGDREVAQDAKWHVINLMDADTPVSAAQNKITDPEDRARGHLSLTPASSNKGLIDGNQLQRNIDAVYMFLKEHHKVPFEFQNQMLTLDAQDALKDSIKIMETSVLGDDLEEAARSLVAPKNSVDWIRLAQLYIATCGAPVKKNVETVPPYDHVIENASAFSWSGVQLKINFILRAFHKAHNQASAASLNDAGVRGAMTLALLAKLPEDLRDNIKNTLQISTVHTVPTWLTLDKLIKEVGDAMKYLIKKAATQSSVCASFYKIGKPSTSSTATAAEPKAAPRPPPRTTTGEAATAPQRPTTKQTTGCWNCRHAAGPEHRVPECPRRECREWADKGTCKMNDKCSFVGTHIKKPSNGTNKGAPSGASGKKS